MFWYLKTSVGCLEPFSAKHLITSKFVHIPPFLLLFPPASFQATAVFVSSWTLVAISFDRFMAIQFAMSPWLKMDRRRAFYAILGTWAFSLAMALPLLIVNEVG
jgi:hypothetical protein